MPLSVIVVGLGQMGRSHATAYHHNPGFQIVGFVNRSPLTLPPELEIYPQLASFEEALRLRPDIVSINSHAESHAGYAIAALESGSHVFVEKPLAHTIDDAERVVTAAKRAGRKLLVGYILRHHPGWKEFIRRARGLGPPFVMRMNLNQRSTGKAWEIHKSLMNTVSPVIDCGVHYIDAMLQITDSHPVQVRGMGVRLTEEIAPGQVNYGHLQLTFADGSVGWYEAGWGPMISETAHFVKDVIGPRGSVSIVGEENMESANIDGHTRTAKVRLHEMGKDVELIEAQGEPHHQQLCDLEQQYLLDAIKNDLDLSKHMGDAVQSLKVVLAADLSMREERAVDLLTTACS